MRASDDRGEMVEVSVDVAARPATVWRCLVERDLLSRWLAADVSLEPRVGGAVRIDFARHGTVVEGEVTELRAPERLVLSWGVSRGEQSDRMPAGSTIVEFRLDAIDAGTRVTLRHRGLPTEEERRDHASGWIAYLASLASVAPGIGNHGRLSPEGTWSSIEGFREA